MFNDELTLIDYEVVPDEIGNQEKAVTRKTIMCSVQSTTRMEYYNYGDAELRPEYVATVNACEYSGEVDCEFKGKQYKITRVYQDDRDLIELTLSGSMQR